MIELLLIAGVGVGLAALIGGLGDDDEAAAPEFSDETDIVADEAYRSGITDVFDDLVREGEVTQEVADLAFGLIDFTSGPQDIDTKGGDDAVLLGAGNDTLDAGEGDDEVQGGAGDDQIDLGAGDDVYGVDFRTISSDDDIEPFPVADDTATPGSVESEEFAEGGNDTILGGTGNDAISDSFGANEINGQQGADFIVSVDDASDEGTPDSVFGGFGNDTLVVDEGDIVDTGRGLDEVVVELYGGVEDGYEVVTLADFDTGIDSLVVQGQPDLLGDMGDVTVEASGADAIVLVNNIPVVRVTGQAGLTVDDITVFVDSR